MKGRQINFFAMPDEWEPLEKYLEENNMICVSVESKTRKFIPEKISENAAFKCIVPKNYSTNLEIKYRENLNLYTIDKMFSPVIEFTRPFYNKETNTLRRSRFYFNKAYWTRDNEWQEKPQDFIEKAEDLFKWFRQNYKNAKLPQWKGFIVTSKVKEKLENENLTLSQL